VIFGDRFPESHEADSACSAVKSHTVHSSRVSFFRDAQREQASCGHIRATEPASRREDLRMTSIRESRVSEVRPSMELS
jgi:hypothetical protein